MREYSFPLSQILFLFLGLCPFYFLPSSWAFTSSRLLASFHDPPKLLCFQTLFLPLGPAEEKQLVASFFVTFALWDLVSSSAKGGSLAGVILLVTPALPPQSDEPPQQAR